MRGGLSEHAPGEYKYMHDLFQPEAGFVTIIGLALMCATLITALYVSLKGANSEHRGNIVRAIGHMEADRELASRDGRRLAAAPGQAKDEIGVIGTPTPALAAVLGCRPGGASGGWGAGAHRGGSNL